jgi:DNA polymerase-3 subunit gamma/tau
MYQVIARKYRPRLFAELVNQQHVRDTLERAITEGRVAHSYIFSGQRGVGKTTVARPLARCLNCTGGPTITPCGACKSCREMDMGNAADVIQIDAASNRGINEMRELRDNVRFQPARDRYRVFIIDEAHQITSEGFNALLKTLEEPPGWAVFVLCTTEAHRIPATIASRCQHFAFRSVGFEDVVGLLERICRQEGIEADPESLAVITQAGDGSVRDSLSALDQAIARCGARLDSSEVRSLLGVFSLEDLNQVTRALLDSDSRRMLEIVGTLVREGHDLQQFWRGLTRHFRNLLVIKIAGAGRLIAAPSSEQERLRDIADRFSQEDLIRYLDLMLGLGEDLQWNVSQRAYLELGLVKLVQASKLPLIEAEVTRLNGTGANAT